VLVVGEDFLLKEVINEVHILLTIWRVAQLA